MAQSDNSDNSMDFLWIGGVIVLLYFIIQIWFGQDIAKVYVQLRLIWLNAITYFWDNENLLAAKRMIETRHVSEISSAQLSQISKDLRLFMFPIFGGIVGWVGFNAIKKNPGRRFKRVLKRKELAQEMISEFPWSLPALKTDLTKVSITEGKWAMAYPPVVFCKQYGLLNGKSLDNKKAAKLFSSQLGKLWTGPNRLNKYNKALFGCFAAQVCGFKEDAEKALKQLVISISADNADFTLAHNLAKIHGNNPKVLNICNKHAYQYTVLMALFDEGKNSGIFPPNHILWLKPMMRQMWFALNCVRRRTYFPEVAGVYSHFLAEKVANHKIEYPYIKNAVSALELALRDIDFDVTEEDLKKIS